MNATESTGNDTLRQTNAFAMQNGLFLGLWGMADLTAFRWSFVYSSLSTVFLLMLLLTPAVATGLTLYFRRGATTEREGLSFGRAFTHTLLTGFYASVWIALGVFVYLQYMDGGAVFNDYAANLNRPEMKAYFNDPQVQLMLSQMGAGKPEDLVEAMRSIGAVNYAALSLYATMVFGPVISALIAAVTMKRPRL